MLVSDTDDICRMMADCTDHGLAFWVWTENDQHPAGPPGALGSSYVNGSGCVNQVRGQKDEEE